MFGSECHLKMHVQNLGYPLAVKIGGFGAQELPVPIFNVL